MSRFDLMHVIQDVHDVATDHHVAAHILGLHRRTESETPDASAVTQLDLQRYIRLARSFKPKISPEAATVLVRCYKKLREDRTFARGSSGVTVRQLESLIRLSEAIARIHLDDNISEDYVKQAFELQCSTLKKVERENIDLNPDVAEGAPAPEATAAEAEAPAAAGDAAARRPRKAKISYAEYERIGKMLAGYLAQKDLEGEEVKEEDLIAWYMEQVEDEIQTEVQLYEQTHLVQLIITRLIDRDHIIIVYRQSEDLQRPELRVLVKHPNFPVGDAITGRATR